MQRILGNTNASLMMPTSLHNRVPRNEHLGDLEEALAAAQLERGRTLTILGVQIGAVLEQYLHYAQVAVDGRQNERRVELAVDLVHKVVDLEIAKEILDDIEKPFLTGDVKASFALFVFRDQIGLNR